ncbi:uncharacterized protein LOC18014661 [Eutrema salsugineum]|uniref:uncharacterized protein LOC18014661 n=1 Tax=Eutrema salsugineum TaxID=72664 RepID=UPI000CED47EE|nr:uncharacterized protein LOC18014661 [Eutrema salsugineum]
MNFAQSQPPATMNNPPLTMNPPNFSLNSNLINPNNYGHNWNGKKMEPIRRMHNSGIRTGPTGTRLQQLHGSGSRIDPPALNKLKSQNSLKTFCPKKKYSNRYVPHAPRNTSSFIISANKSGGIAELVSPCPVTPMVLPTPNFSPSEKVLSDMAKEEWGVDSHGTMKGLIRLRSDGGIHELEPYDEDDDEDEGGSCVSCGGEEIRP